MLRVQLVFLIFRLSLPPVLMPGNIEYIGIPSGNRECHLHKNWKPKMDFEICIKGQKKFAQKYMKKDGK